MIITKRNEVFYKIEMTAEQAANLQILLETSLHGHVNELTVSELHGKEIADSVHRTIGDLLDALEKR